MQELFHASDIDGTGQIDYEEFIAAMLDSNRVARRKEAVRGGWLLGVVGGSWWQLAVVGSS